MKILQLAIQAQGGGAEKVATTLHQEFSKSETSWICFLSDDMRIEIENSKYLHLPNSNFAKFFLGVVRFRKLARQIKPEITVLHCEPSIVIGAFTSKIGKPFVVEHQPFIWTGLKAIVIRLAILILKYRGLKTIYLRRERTRSNNDLFIPNPVEAPVIQNPSFSPSSNFKLVYIGRLAYDKGYDRLPAVLELSQENRLEVYGVGELGQRVSFGNAQVKFHGYVSNLWKSIPTDSLILVPSRWEGDGLVILEALSRQIPLLVLEFDAIRELPLNKDSICRNEQEMAERIIKLRSNQLSINSLVNPQAIEQINELRNPQKISSKYLEVFRRELAQ